MKLNENRIRFILLIQLCFVCAQLHYDDEVHLTNIRQLTFGGQNAEAYFSFNDRYLTFQATGIDDYGTNCDQIYQLDLKQQTSTENGAYQIRRMSTGVGVCTCSYFYPDNSHILYAGTFHNVNFTNNANSTCPLKKCQSPEVVNDPILQQLCNTSYTWDIYPQFDIFKVNQFGNVVQQLTDVWGYDAEATLSPDGKSIVFTSTRNGDIDLYRMDVDGRNVRQLTNITGYDGGAFFSPDGTKIVFRASRPKTTAELDKYKKLLSYDLVAPTEMELFVIDAVDGANMRQVTKLGGANWAPFYLSDNRRIIFSSDYNSTQGFGAFDLFIINDDGSGLEKITHDNENFDSFPMFSYDGKQLVWASSRNGNNMYDLNLFIADWIDKPQLSHSMARSIDSLLLLILSLFTILYAI